MPKGGGSALHGGEVSSNWWGRWKFCLLKRGHPQKNIDDDQYDLVANSGVCF